MRTQTPPRTRSRITAVIAASHVGVDLTIGAVAGLLPAIRDEAGLTGGQVAIIATVLGAVSSFGQPVAGRMIDRRGPRWLAVWGAAATAIVLGALPSLSSFPTLLGAAVLGGAGAAVYHPAAAALTRTSSDEGHTATALGLFAAGGTAGLAAGPLLATWAAGPFGALLPVVLALPGVLLAIALASATASIVDDSGDVATATRSAGSMALVESLQSTLPLVVAMSGVFASSITFTTAVPLWLADTGRSSVIGSTLAVYSLAAAVGGLIGGRLTAVTGTPSHAAIPMLAAPAALLGVANTNPGSAAWFVTIAAAGMFGFTAVPVALDAAQARLSGAVASASGLLMGLPIGLASVAYLSVTTIIDPIEIGTATRLAAAATTAGALLTFQALSHRRLPTGLRRLPTCTCSSGNLAIANC